MKTGIFYSVSFNKKVCSPYKDNLVALLFKDP